MRAAALLPLLTIGLRLRGFRFTRDFLKKFLRRSASALAQDAVEERIAITTRMVLAAARNSPIRSTCLERALCLWWLLARLGISSQLRIGVQKGDREFTAHAWVERGGAAIGEPDASHLHYAAFTEDMSGSEP